MKIPKKITPDRIREAIVEIKYRSRVPFEIVPGYVFRALDDTYRYIMRPTPTPALPPHEEAEIVGLQFQFGSHMFHKDRIKIVLKPGSFVFNCLDSYVSWSTYLPEIKRFLEQISGADVVESFERVGLRYISVYEDMDLLPLINFSYAVKIEEYDPKNFRFNSEFEYKGKTVILNISNQLPQIDPNQKTSKPKTVSQIDIDVIQKNISVSSNDLALLVNHIESIHETEKEIYFSLLTEEFIATLNPEY